MPRVPLSSENSSFTTLRIPSNLHEDITFHHLPTASSSSLQLEAKDLRRFIQNGLLFEYENLSLLSKSRAQQQDLLTNFKNIIDESDIELQADEFQNFLAAEQELDELNGNDSKIIDLFQKRYFKKHGSDFVIVSRKADPTAPTNENKRATSLYSSREAQLRVFGETEKQNLSGTSPIKGEDIDADNQNHNLPSQAPLLAQNRAGLFFRHEITHPFGGFEEPSKVFGAAIVVARPFSHELKLQYCMCNHSFSSSLETIFSASLDQVARIIEESDKIFNQRSLKELMHRKGLNLRFLWPLLAKVRYHRSRQLVMISLLLRVMRKIVNEEVKLKCIAMQPAPLDSAQPGLLSSRGSQVEEYYQGGGVGSVDTYKEMLTFYINTLLKRKMHKYRAIFEETLQGLFLSRLHLLPLIHALGLRKEEQNYLESKDVLEDILEAPSKNPSLFINAVASYFNIEFKADFLRVLRQDKYVFLCKTQPVGKSDIKPMQCRTSIRSYFSLKEESYFLLATLVSKSTESHSLSQNLQTKGTTARIKTKTDKDRAPRRPNGVDMLMASAREYDQDSNRSFMGRSISSSQIFEDIVIQTREGESQTHRQKQLVVHDFRQPKEVLTTIRQYQNMEALMNDQGFGEDSTIKLLPGHHNQIHDFSKFSKRANFKPTGPNELVLPPILYKLKTASTLHYFDDGSRQTATALQAYYEMPQLDIVEKWTIVMESLLKDIIGVDGSEQVLLEALALNALMIFFYKSGGDSDEYFKILMKIRDALFSVAFCAPETIAFIQILTGMFFEEKRDTVQVEAEKSYLTAMICLFQIHGDPRGRGNYTMPYSLFLSWKLSLLSLAEDKKLHDSEFAEELFDATLQSLLNHKKCFREQQLAMFGDGANKKENSGSQLPTEVMQSNGPDKTKFEQDQEKNERQKLKFDLKKYKFKPFNVTYASGVHRQAAAAKLKQTNTQAAMNVYVSVNHHYNNNQELKGSAFKRDRKSTDLLTISQDLLKSRSNLPSITAIRRRRGAEGEDDATNIKQEYDLEPSDIDIEVEDDGKQLFIDENFKPSESSVGECPFQHWSLYRRRIMQILQSHNFSRNREAQLQYHKQVYGEMVQKILPKEPFYSWLLRFNPMAFTSGQQWSNEQIKDFIFNQSQQHMINSSSSSVVMSHHNLSHHSLTSGVMSQTGHGVKNSVKEKRGVRLGSYSQILGKEVGAISKSDMHGILFTMGTDAYGQLGLEAVTSQVRETHSISLKVLYPRMILSLRDEMIKEICCGHCHTMAINVHGQVFAWGLNESGQLGLGPDAPAVIRKPVLNPYLYNVTKLSAGNEHSLAITKSGDLFVWGGGGLTGLNDPNIRPIPTKMDFFQTLGTKISQAVCGGLHTVVVTKEGDVYSWGSTEGGQLGLPQDVIQQLCEGIEQPVLSPQKIKKLEGIPIAQIANGEAHSIAIAKDGRLFGWGMSNYGQLGLGFSSDSFEPGIGMEKSKVHEPQEITHLKGQQRITKIICGATFSLFQTDKGDLYGCGMNDLGQLGLDTYMEDLLSADGGLDKVKRGKQTSSDVTVPTKVICFQGIALHNIACGENHALAVSGDDRNMLWAWGMYRQGQLGLGEVTTKMNPRPVQTLCSTSVHKISCGSMHSLALIGDPQQVSHLSSQYYAGSSNFDVFQNYWSIDLRPLYLPLRNAIYQEKQEEMQDQFQLAPHLLTPVRRTFKE